MFFHNIPLVFFLFCPFGILVSDMAQEEQVGHEVMYTITCQKL